MCPYRIGALVVILPASVIEELGMGRQGYWPFALQLTPSRVMAEHGLFHGSTSIYAIERRGGEAVSHEFHMINTLHFSYSVMFGGNLCI